MSGNHHYSPQGTRDLPFRQAPSEEDSSSTSSESGSEESQDSIEYRRLHGPPSSRDHLNRHAAQLIKRDLLARDASRAVPVITSKNNPGHGQDTKRAPYSPADVDIPDAPTDNPRKRKNMTKPVLFYGKAAQLGPVLTHYGVAAIVNNTPEDRKAAALAESFRGAALSWLTTKIEENPEFLNQSYTDFVDTLRERFGLTDTAQKAQAARQLTHCRQKTSVAEFVDRLEPLVQQSETPDQTAVALFMQGLKPQIRNALIVKGTHGSFDAIVLEAQRIDESLYYGRSNRQGQKGRATRNTPSRGGRRHAPKAEKYEY